MGDGIVSLTVHWSRRPSPGGTVGDVLLAYITLNHFRGQELGLGRVSTVRPIRRPSRERSRQGQPQVAKQVRRRSLCGAADQSRRVGAFSTKSCAV
jgi:hypothetical protein